MKWDNNNFIRNKLGVLFTIMGVFILIVLFQNCGENNFQTKFQKKIELESESSNDHLGSPDDNLRDILGVDDSIRSVIATSTTGKVYYVSTSGSNSNAGTISKPFRNVAYAVSKMVAGDTTYVRGGLYNESGVRFGKSGTQTAPIKLLSYPGESPIINMIDPKNTQHMLLIQNSAGYLKPIGWITIEGFEIRNGYVGLKFQTLHDSVIRRNWIHHGAHQGINGSGTRIKIDRNRINSNGPFASCFAGYKNELGTGTICNQSHGIYVNGTNITVTNNLIYDNLAYGIVLNGAKAYDPKIHAGSQFILSANWIIANNTFAYNFHSSGIVVSGSSCNNALIDNNIFYENGVNVANSAVQGVVFSYTTCKGIKIRNNLSYASGSGAAKFIGGNATKGVHYTESGSIVSNPLFVNAPATLPSVPNFALTSKSFAINKGLTTTATNVDIRGIARPRGGAYDIGAYEY